MATMDEWREAEAMHQWRKAEVEAMHQWRKAEVARIATALRRLIPDAVTRVVPWAGARGYWYVEIRDRAGRLLVRVLNAELEEQEGDFDERDS